MIDLHIASWKTTVMGLLGIGLAALAAAEATSDRTLIIISLIANGTLLIVTAIGAGVSFMNNRTLKGADKKLAVVAEIPRTVEKLAEQIDGRMNDLLASKQETSVAKQEVARAAGVQQERAEARDRVKEQLETTKGNL